MEHRDRPGGEIDVLGKERKSLGMTEAGSIEDRDQSSVTKTDRARSRDLVQQRQHFTRSQDLGFSPRLRGEYSRRPGGGRHRRCQVLPLLAGSRPL